MPRRHPEYKVTIGRLDSPKQLIGYYPNREEAAAAARMQRTCGHRNILVEISKDGAVIASHNGGLCPRLRWVKEGGSHVA